MPPIWVTKAATFYAIFHSHSGLFLCRNPAVDVETGGDGPDLPCLVWPDRE